MKEFLLESEIILPRPIDEIFAFFANARNLEILTPPWLNFQILTPMPIKMRPGALIEYRIRVHGIPIRWKTEIVEWLPPQRFVDVQLRGPYKLWRHTHTFEARDDRTVCRDHVSYRPRGGALINRWLVRPDLDKVFAFRREKLFELFPPIELTAKGTPH